MLQNTHFSFPENKMTIYFLQPFPETRSLSPGSRDLKRSSEETERCERRRAGAVLVWNNSQTEMASLEEVKALLFALVRGSPWAEGVLLNQDLAVRSTSILRDFHAYFLSALSNCLLDLVREPWDCLRLVEFHDDLLDHIGARTNPTRASGPGASVQQMLDRVARLLWWVSDRRAAGDIDQVSCAGARYCIGF
jgi:hypothetical protein